MYLFQGRMCLLSITGFVSLTLLSVCGGDLVRKEYNGPGITCFNDEGYIGRCTFFHECYEEDKADTIEIEQMIHKDCPQLHKPTVCCLHDQETQSNSTQTSFSTPPNCGKTLFDDLIDDRIVGGDVSRPGAWPWAVILGVKYTHNWVVWICGGTLISQSWVLTAAHCHYESPSLLNWSKLGSTDLKQNTEDTIELGVESFIVHEHYIQGTFFNDIGLIKLSEKVKYSNYIRPICLPIEKDMIYDEYLGEYPFIAGWGSTVYHSRGSRVLMELQIPIVDRQICNNIYQKKGTSIKDTQICAGILKGGKDACQGDSGGGLMLYNSKHHVYYAIGVVSYGYKCAVAGYPGVYTRVGLFIDWINDTILNKN